MDNLKRIGKIVQENASKQHHHQKQQQQRKETGIKI